MAKRAEQHASPPPASKPPSLREDALAVVTRLRQAGHTAYFAGGCVRDLLLGIPPKDYDVATDAPPDRVRALFPVTQAVGAAFGVILVKHHRSIIEVATFRSDGAYLDGRRPAEVRFTNAEEDAKRRDFTINGLFFDPVDSRVLDFIGGQADLAARLIRAIGQPEHRFQEDHLRLLRAVRFAARYDFSIEPATAAAIRHHAPQLARISPERIGEELRLILTPPSRAIAWRLLGELELAPLIFRFCEAPPQSRAAEPPKHPIDLFAHLAPQESIPFGLALAAAALQWLMPAWESGGQFISVVTIAIQRIPRALRQSLKLSNDESDELKGTLEGISLLLAKSDPPSLAVMKRFLARPTARLTRQLLRAFCQSIASYEGSQPLVDRHAELESRLADLERTDFAPIPLLNGDDLTAAGFSPGPMFKRLLNEVYDAQLENRITSREQAMDMARHLATVTVRG